MVGRTKKKTKSCNYNNSLRKSIDTKECNITMKMARKLSVLKRNKLDITYAIFFADFFFFFVLSFCIYFAFCFFFVFFFWQILLWILFSYTLVYFFPFYFYRGQFVLVKSSILSRRIYIRRNDCGMYNIPKKVSFYCKVNKANGPILFTLQMCINNKEKDHTETKPKSNVKAFDDFRDSTY